MPLAVQLHLVMMSKYSKSGVDTFNTFWVMEYIDVFARLLTGKNEMWPTFNVTIISSSPAFVKQIFTVLTLVSFRIYFNSPL